MSKESIKPYLQNRFNRDNHDKYLKYFEEWFLNLTDNQVYYFIKDFENERKNK